MDDAKEAELTPAQQAEVEENKKPLLEKFKALVDEAADRCKHGTSLPQTFVNALEDVYHEAAGTVSDRQKAADEAAKAAAEKRQKILDEAKRMEDLANG